jgi:hypothetical protein
MKTRLKIRLMGGCAAMLILAAAQVALADGSHNPQRPFVTVSDMHIFPNGPAVVGISIMTRDETAVDATVSTTGLSPAGAYSWWWVVFNRPQYCVDGCGLDDLPVGATPVSNGDPRVRASLLWGGGFVSDDTGSANAAARLERAAPPGEVRFGPGLLNVRKADIHVALRSHGEAVAGEVAEQIGSFDGGCTPEEITAGQCPNANVQFAVHPGKGSL